MSQAMLIGAVRKTAEAPTGTPSHLRIEARDWDGVALPIAPGLNWEDEGTMIAFAQKQHAILCHYAQAHDTLPFALGAAFSSAQTIATHIDGHSQVIAARFARFEGLAEYTLEISMLQSPIPMGPARSGRDHLRSRKSVRDKRRSRAAERHAFAQTAASSFGTLSRAQKWREVQDTALLGKLDMLLPRDRMGDCKNALSSLGARASEHELEVALVGPYPPFSFIGETSDAAV